jgi:SAM-dependent methyltransferase
MNTDTSTKLVEINQSFYRLEARGFSQTRQTPWRGWQILMDNYVYDRKPLRVLDIGCGNGRFGSFLFEHYQIETYVGIDFSQELIKIAKDNLKEYSQAVLLSTDIFTKGIGRFNQPFDLVVLWGILHHIPNYSARITLINQALELTSGVFAASLWQFAKFERFKKLEASWDNLPDIDQSQLEAGDYLLNFNDSDHYRYCHSFSDQEIKRIKTDLLQPSITEYQADGKEGYNRYIISC